jgi:putative transposase
MKTNHASQAEVNPEYLPPPELWELFEMVLPPWPPRPKGGHPPMDDKKAFDAVYYVLRTGIQWNALPRILGASSTIHRRFQKWAREGVLIDLWRLCLYVYDQMVGIDWEWQAMDGAMTKAPLGCENTGPNPTDRAKKGTKRHLLTEGNGIPLSVVVTGANRNDFKETANVLDHIVIERPEPTKRKKQHLCLDKGYDYSEVKTLVDEFGYTAHIKSRGEEVAAKNSIPGYRSRRWVVERTHSWMNRFRRIMVRWEKKTQNYEGFLHLACAFITLRATGVLG